MLHVESGETVELMDRGGLLLGVNAGAQYREQRVLLGPGDVLALTTDGLTEARRWSGGSRDSNGGGGRVRDFFGYDGLVRAVREEVAQNPSSLADAGMAVAKRAREFAGGTINDDVCLLLARRIERGEPSR